MTTLSAHLNHSSVRCVTVTAISWSKIRPASHCDKVVRNRRVEKSLSYTQSSRNYRVDPSGSETYFLLD